MACVPKWMNACDYVNIDPAFVAPAYSRHGVLEKEPVQKKKSIRSNLPLSFNFFLRFRFLKLIKALFGFSGGEI